MRRNKLIWHIFPYHLLILLGAVLAVLWFSSQSLRDFYRTQLSADLKARTRLIEPLVADLLARNDMPALERICRETGIKALTRITVVDAGGTVLCDSEYDPHRMVNHATRPEIAQAMNRQVGHAIRYSATLQTNMIYVAIPVVVDKSLAGVLRAALPVVSIDRAMGHLYWPVIGIALVVVVLAAGCTLLLSTRISQPLIEIRRGAERFAAGAFSRRIAVSGSEEIVGLAQAMNSMAAQLDDRIQAVLAQRRELEIIFSSMIEGVLTVDDGQRITSLNEAAAGMLRIGRNAAVGKPILEAVRNLDLLHFIQHAVAGEKPPERTIVLGRNRGDERMLRVYGTQLVGDSGYAAGALVVMNDVTRLLRLENVRRDFVANVSHELKTPITSIKGYVETLLDGDLVPSQQAKDFLGVIHKQANRLQAIVEDILALSRIEQGVELDAIELNPGDIRAVLLAAIENCAPNAADKNIEITLHCPDGLRAAINAPLLEQAVTNLIDNAVKYSEPEGAIRVGAEAADSMIRVTVKDTGIGIAREHLPRLFERFYLVDKARSRKLGGTGLGLAIVKHIAVAHGGQVQVESTLGGGSTFSLQIPA